MLAAGDDTRIIAGGPEPRAAHGHAACPAEAADRRRPDLRSGLRRDAVSIGATTRQCVLERDAVRAVPVPKDVIQYRSLDSDTVWPDLR
jgi:hypothetical protein